MTTRFTKQEAASAKRVSLATIDRMIRRGELTVEREPWGNRERVWVLLDTAEQTDASAASSDATSAMSDDPITVAVLQERLDARDREIETYKERLKEWEYRYHELVQTLPKSLPPAPRSLLRRLWDWLPRVR